MLLDKLARFWIWICVSMFIFDISSPQAHILSQVKCSFALFKSISSIWWFLRIPLQDLMDDVNSELSDAQNCFCDPFVYSSDICTICELFFWNLPCNTSWLRPESISIRWFSWILLSFLYFWNLHFTTEFLGVPMLNFMVNVNPQL